MPFADVGHERLYYEISGQGPRLVLIRGLSRSMRFWEPFIPFLEDKFELMLFDHRGIGRSPVNHMPFRAPDLAEDLGGLLEQTGFFPAHIFGLSLGGMVAQHLALNHGDKIDKLILASTTAGGRKSRFPRVDTLLKLGLYSAALPVKTSVKMQGPLIMSKREHKQNPDKAAAWATNLQLEPLNSKVVLHQALSGAFHSTWRDVGRITNKTMVITGTADRLINAVNSRRLADWIPNAELVQLDGLGHDIVAEAPDAVGREVRRFLLEA